MPTVLTSPLFGEKMKGNHDSDDDPKSPLLPVNDPVEPSSRSPFSLKSLVTLKSLYVLLGPLLCTVICLCVKFDGPVASRNMLALLAWVFAWWLTEAVPMPITSMAPLFLFPLFGIASADSVAHSYMDDVITLVLGSFILVLAVERYNIHRRLALNVSYTYEFIRFKYYLSLQIDSLLLKNWRSSNP